jgi:hypothetical protein
MESRSTFYSAMKLKSEAARASVRNGGPPPPSPALATLRVAPDVQAIFFRRRHQPRSPPLAKIRPGRPAPAMGAGTGVKVKLSNVNVGPVLLKTALVMPKSERLRKIFGGRPVPAPMKFAPPVDTDPNIVAPLKIDSVIDSLPVTKAPTELTGVVKVAVMVPIAEAPITLGSLTGGNTGLSDTPLVRTTAKGVKLTPGN